MWHLCNITKVIMEHMKTREKREGIKGILKRVGDNIICISMLGYVLSSVSIP